jgi:hypothetical protein
MAVTAAARSVAPLAAMPVTAVAGSTAPLRAAPAPAMMLYVVYVDGGDAGWIRILWVHEIPAPALNHT